MAATRSTPNPFKTVPEEPPPVPVDPPAPLDAVEDPVAASAAPADPLAGGVSPPDEHALALVRTKRTTTNVEEKSRKRGMCLVGLKRIFGSTAARSAKLGDRPIRYLRFEGLKSITEYMQDQLRWTFRFPRVRGVGKISLSARFMRGQGCKLSTVRMVVNQAPAIWSGVHRSCRWSLSFRRLGCRQLTISTRGLGHLEQGVVGYTAGMAPGRASLSPRPSRQIAVAGYGNCS
jgi:hypothetical protein